MAQHRGPRVMLRFLDWPAAVKAETLFIPTETTYLGFLNMAEVLSGSVADKLQGLEKSRVKGEGLQVSEGRWWYRVARRIPDVITPMVKGPWLPVDTNQAYLNLVADITRQQPIGDGWIELQHDLQKQRDRTTADHAQRDQDVGRTAQAATIATNSMIRVTGPGPGPASYKTLLRPTHPRDDGPLIVHSPIPPGYNARDDEDEHDHRSSSDLNSGFNNMAPLLPEEVHPKVDPSTPTLIKEEVQQPGTASHFNPNTAPFIPGGFGHPNSLYVPSAFGPGLYPAYPPDPAHGVPQQEVQYQHSSPTQYPTQPMLYPLPDAAQGTAMPYPAPSAPSLHQRFPHWYDEEGYYNPPVTYIPSLHATIAQEREMLHREFGPFPPTTDFQHPLHQSRQSLHYNPIHENSQTASIGPSPAIRPAVGMAGHTSGGTRAATMDTAEHFNQSLTMGLESMAAISAATQPGLINPGSQRIRTHPYVSHKRPYSRHTSGGNVKHQREPPAYFRTQNTALPPLGHFSPPKPRVADHHAARVFAQFNPATTSSRAAAEYRHHGADPALDIHNQHEFTRPSMTSTTPTTAVSKRNVSRASAKVDAVPKEDEAAKQLRKEQKAKDRAERAQRRASMKVGGEDAAAAAAAEEGGGEGADVVSAANATAI